MKSDLPVLFAILAGLLLMVAMQTGRRPMMFDAAIELPEGKWRGAIEVQLIPPRVHLRVLHSPHADARPSERAPAVSTTEVRTLACFALPRSIMATC